MKKILSVLLVYSFILLLLNACFSEASPTNDWKRLHLQGAVQQLKEWHYASYQAFEQKKQNYHLRHWLSKEGLLTKSMSYGKEEKKVVWSHYNYSNDSVWVRRALQIEGGVEQNQNYWLYQLNAQGQQKVLTSLLLDTSVFYTITVDFDQNQCPRTLLYSDAQRPDLIPCQVNKIYNNQKRVTKEVVYDYDTKTAQCLPTPTTSTYTYNDKGYLDRENIEYINGKKVTYSYRYQYDDIGNWTIKMDYKGDKVVGVTKRQITYY